MEKKELYSVPAIEEIESRLACAVAQGVSPAFGEGEEPDNQGGHV